MTASDEHGDRPDHHAYVKCLGCGFTKEIEAEDLDTAVYLADCDARTHRGVMDCEGATIVIDGYGEERARFHPIPDCDPSPYCPKCKSHYSDDRVACPDCGHIPNEDRLRADGGRDESADTVDRCPLCKRPYVAVATVDECHSTEADGQVCIHAHTFPAEVYFHSLAGDSDE